jgi:hypothetical protein
LDAWREAKSNWDCRSCAEVGSRGSGARNSKIGEISRCDGWGGELEGAADLETSGERSTSNPEPAMPDFSQAKASVSPKRQSTIPLLLVGLVKHAKKN